jgi:hypothetical protein
MITAADLAAVGALVAAAESAQENVFFLQRLTGSFGHQRGTIERAEAVVTLVPRPALRTDPGAHRHPIRLQSPQVGIPERTHRTGTAAVRQAGLWSVQGRST